MDVEGRSKPRKKPPSSGRSMRDCNCSDLLQAFEENINPFSATAYKLFRAEKCAHTRLQTVYLISNLLSVLPISIEISSRAHGKGGKKP